MGPRRLAPGGHGRWSPPAAGRGPPSRGCSRTPSRSNLRGRRRSTPPGWCRCPPRTAMRTRTGPRMPRFQAPSCRCRSGARPPTPRSPFEQPYLCLLLIDLGVERLVDETVGVGILLARDIADRPAVEALERRPHLDMKLAQRRVLDLVLAAHLADDQLRVANELKLPGPERPRPFDSEEERAVFRDVVGCTTDGLRVLVNHAAVGLGQYGRDRRRPRVAARAAVDVDDQPLGQASFAASCGWRSAAERRRSVPSSSTTAFQARAASSSSETSAPFATSRTGSSPSPSAPTSHWYHQSSPAPVTRPSWPRGSGRTPAWGSPSERMRPATLRRSSLELKRSTARLIRASGPRLARVLRAVAPVRSCVRSVVPFVVRVRIG